MGTHLQVSQCGEAISAGQKGSGPLKGHLQKGHFMGFWTLWRVFPHTYCCSQSLPTP